VRASKAFHARSGVHREGAAPTTHARGCDSEPSEGNTICCPSTRLGRVTSRCRTNRTGSPGFYCPRLHRFDVAAFEPIRIIRARPGNPQPPPCCWRLRLPAAVSCLLSQAKHRKSQRFFRWYVWMISKFPRRALRTGPRSALSRDNENADGKPRRSSQCHGMCRKGDEALSAPTYSGAR